MILNRIALLGSCSLIACATANGGFDHDGDEGLSEPTSAPIIGGTTASAYPEAALLDMYTAGAAYPSSICSASVIAPRVVLTAGHCVEGFVKWRVKAPFAGSQTVMASSGGTYDWAGAASGSVDPKRHDVGLVYLDAPITLGAYPTVATTASAEGTKIVNIGRIDDGVASHTSLFVGAPIAIQNGSRVGHPYAYYSSEIIQSGDSGGPDEIAGTHTIVAVNSGAGGGTQVLARVDLVYAWIDTQVKSHGGWPGTSTAPPPPASPAPACAQNESESNDSYTAPNALGSGATCGSLSGGNQDWFSFTTAAASYSVKVVGTGDARVQLWKLVNGQYYRVANTTPTEVTKTSNGAGSYVLVVFSPGSAGQTYVVTR